jgi:hypothetical protein
LVYFDIGFAISVWIDLRSSNITKLPCLSSFEYLFELQVMIVEECEMEHLDIVAAEGSPVKSFLDKLNLPHLLAGNAGTAIVRLIAGATDIPAAWLESKTQAIRDQKDARSLISRKMSEKAAELAINDTAQMDRAMTRWLGESVRMQNNREEVARKTLDNLADDPAPPDASPVDDDWLDSFSSHAEKANSERMRNLWGKILAGEIRKQGTFGLSTMRLMAEMDQQTALAIEKHFQRVFAGSLIIYQNSFNSGEDLRELTLLENIGLLNGLGNTRNNTIVIDGTGIRWLLFRKHAVLIHGRPGTSFKFDSLILTRMGAEALSLLRPDDAIERAYEIIPHLPSEGVEKVSWVPVAFVESQWKATGPEQVLWTRPTVPIAS